jgi:hypothetical protein
MFDGTMTPAAAAAAVDRSAAVPASTTEEKPDGAPAPETDTDEAEYDSADAPGEAADEDLEDVEFGGKQYRLPKELKSALMMQADYTRKTQEVADGRRALASEREALRQQAELHQQNLRDVGRLVAIDEQLAAYGSVDWHKLEAEDPFEAQRLFRVYSMLKDQRGGLIAQIEHHEQMRSSQAQQALAKRYADTNATLAREINGWNEVAPKLLDFAKANGVSESDMDHLAVNVPLVKLLHKAWLGDQLIAKQKAAARSADASAKAEPEPLKQVAKGRGTPAASGLSDSLSPEEWVRRRNEQLRRR